MFKNQSLNADGTVTICHGKSKEVWFPWDAPEGGIRVEGARWLGNQSPHCLTLSCLISRKEPSEAPLAKLFFTIPEKIRDALACFPSLRYRTLRLAQLNPKGFLRIVRKAPFLVQLIVAASEECSLWPENYWADLMSKPMKTILSSLCIHPDAAGLVARVKDVEQDVEAIFRRICLDKRLRRILKHEARIDSDMIYLAGICGYAVVRSPGLLHITSPVDWEYPAMMMRSETPLQTYQLVESILQLRKQLGMDRWPYGNELRTWSQLEGIHERLMLEAAKQNLTVETLFPRPPKWLMNPRYRWVDSCQSLAAVADDFWNCLQQYEIRCMAGIAAVFVLEDKVDPVAVLLEYSRGRWEVSAAERPFNQEIEPAEMATVRADFSRV